LRNALSNVLLVFVEPEEGSQVQIGQHVVLVLNEVISDQQVDNEHHRPDGLFLLSGKRIDLLVSCQDMREALQPGCGAMRCFGASFDLCIASPKIFPDGFSTHEVFPLPRFSTSAATSHGSKDVKHLVLTWEKQKNGTP
jgi:hypothetical protein